MGIAEKKEVLLFVVAIFALLVLGSNFNLTGNASQRYTPMSRSYYCYDSDGLSTLKQGTVTYRNSGSTEMKKTDYCLQEGKAGSSVHEFWCAEQTMEEENIPCSWTQKCVKGRCVSL